MVAGATSTVYFNEIHYDNTGPADIAEFFEIANTSNTDLTGWSVVLYDRETPYQTISLSGSAAYTVITTALQNGPRDGLALVNNLGVVVQFLSYEGVITATSGAANGLTSTEIPQVERGATGVAGQSIQLVGTGTTAGDFTWAAPATATSGAQNTAQTMVFPDNHITGTNGLETITGSDGARDFIVAKNGDDLIYGRGGDDYVLGNRHNDTIHGGDGHDILYGGTQNDIIFGDAGDDKIYGDQHNDELTGGTGADSFYFKKGFGTDVINDFEDGVDTLHFARKVFASVEAVLAGAVQDGADVVITDAAGNSVRVENVVLANLTSADILIF